MPILVSSLDRYSDFSTEVVPIRIGWPLACRSSISSATASNFASSDL
jgi:hypothetical protein